MAKKNLDPKEFQKFFDDVTAGIMEVKGAPKNFAEAIKKYDLQIPELSEQYNADFTKLINTDFTYAQRTGTHWHCEVCSVCALCILCGEANAGVGVGSVSGIFGLFNATNAAR